MNCLRTASVWFLSAIVISDLAMGEDVKSIYLEAEPRCHSSKTVPIQNPTLDCFSIDLDIDPVIDGLGDVQVVAGFALGVTDGFIPKNGIGPVREKADITIGLREGSGRSCWLIWHQGKDLIQDDPDPVPRGYRTDPTYQHHNTRLIADVDSYHVRLVVWPDHEGSLVRLFIDSLDRPVEEYYIDKRIRLGTVLLYTSRGGQPGDPSQKSLFRNANIQKLSLEDAKRLPTYWDTILSCLDPKHQKMQQIIALAKQGKSTESCSHFIDHMRTRKTPHGPMWENVSDRQLARNWEEVANEALRGRYGTLGFSAKFDNSWTDTNGEKHVWVTNEKPLQLNWGRENGHLNRHFHWVALAKAWDETRSPEYAERIGAEVIDWVGREPFFWKHCPTVGGVWLMDGTVFRRGFMNTSNIGRRLELTWWPTFETIRHTNAFNDEAVLAMLVGMIRQAELIMNPTSFAVHDDGGSHTTLALLTTALLLPELKLSKKWKEIALQRWDQIIEQQFHPDGSHVSLSTGYNWASILTLENFIRLYEQLGIAVPEKCLKTLEHALEYPVAFSTPNQTQIALNDGGWGMVDDHYQRIMPWFQHRSDFQWMASRGQDGSPPNRKSVYFPNAGHYAMRSGWGENQKFLFFGAGPWGASHGKQDALNIYAQFGNTLLVRDAGRGSYSGIGNTVHAGKSLSYNTLSPDWAQENSIPHWRHEMAVGFNPPNRRWVQNANCEYGEGLFKYGWHRPGEHIQGNWLRQVLFMKGTDVLQDGYYVILDTVVPKTSEERTWRHPFQLHPDDIRIDDTNTATAFAPDAALQILPIDPSQNISVKIIKGQEQPELLGWRIYDKTAKPWPVPTYIWKEHGTFCRGWVIQMQGDQSMWPVTSITDVTSQSEGELAFSINRKDGGTDHFLRRFPSKENKTWRNRSIEGDLVILTETKNGQTSCILELENGAGSVADVQTR